MCVLCSTQNNFQINFYRRTLFNCNKKTPRALRMIKDDVVTDEMRWAAIIQEPILFKSIEGVTEEMLNYVIDVNPLLLKYVERTDLTNQLYWRALKTNIITFKYIKYKETSMMVYAIEQNPTLIKYFLTLSGHLLACVT